MGTENEITINGMGVIVDEGETLGDLTRRGLIPAGHSAMIRGQAGGRLLREDEVIEVERGDIFTTPKWIYGR